MRADEGEPHGRGWGIPSWTMKRAFKGQEGLQTGNVLHLHEEGQGGWDSWSGGPRAWAKRLEVGCTYPSKRTVPVCCVCTR